MSDKKPTDPVSFGFDFKIIRGYQSGGAGYLLSNEAMKSLNSKWRKLPWKIGSTEDAEVGKILRSVNVSMRNSLDEKGREHFHPLCLLDHYDAFWLPWLPKNVKIQENFFLFFILFYVSVCGVIRKRTVP